MRSILRIRLGRAETRAAIAVTFAAVMLIAPPVPSLGEEMPEGETPAAAEPAVLVSEPSTDVADAMPPAPSDEGTQGEEPTPVAAGEQAQPVQPSESVDDQAQPPEGPSDLTVQSAETADAASVPTQSADDENPPDAPATEGDQGGQPDDPTPDTPEAPVAQAVRDGLYELTSALGDTLRLEVTTSSGSQAPKAKAATNAASQRWRVKCADDGYCTLQNVATGTYLQAPAMASGTSVALSLGKSDGSETQQWRIVEDPAREGYLIVWSRAHPDRVLHLASTSRADTFNIRLRVASGAAAQSFSALSVEQELDDGFYVIANKGSGLVLDVASGSLGNSANVQQWTGNKSPAQTFKLTYHKSNGYYSVVNVQSGKSLDVYCGRSADGTNVQQYAYTGSRAQLWCIKAQADGSFSLFSSIDGRALTVQDGSKAKGGNVQTYHSTGATSQKWDLRPQVTWLPEGTYEIVTSVNTGNAVSMGKSIASSAMGVTAARDASDTSARWQLVWVDEGHVRLVNLGSGYVLTVGDADNAKGARVVQRKWAGADAQLWCPVFRTGGVLLQSSLDGRIALDICNGSKGAGAGLQTWTSKGTAAQLFHFVKKRTYELKTPYVIRSVSARTGVIDIKQGSNADGAAAQLHKANDTTAQTFVFVDAGGGLVRIRNIKSEKYLARDAKGTGVVQISDGTGDDTKWCLRFDADLNALTVEVPSNRRLLSACSEISQSLSLAGASTESASEGFVLGVDADVLVYKSTGKAARSKRVNVAGRGWLWADDTCKLHGKITVSVPYVNQYDHGAIMGCEGAALYMCLRQAGYCKNVTYEQFLRDVVRSPNGNPNYGFVGSPWVITGNVDGVLPKGAVLWVDKYANGHDVSGIGAAGLFNLLCHGTPVAVWVTPHFRASYATKFYGVTVPNSWHTVTLTGYDPKSNKLRIADPASDAHVYWVSWDTFFGKWNMGQNAVTVS